MFTLLDFGKFSLNEKIELGLAKYYTRLWKEAGGPKWYKSIFGNKMRIEIPFEKKKDWEEDAEANVPDFLRIEIINLMDEIGIESDDVLISQNLIIRGNKKLRLTRVLKKEGKHEKKDQILRDYEKWLSSNKASINYTIIVGRHPVDIAGQSTGRGWNSCLNLIGVWGNEANGWIEADIKKGSIIAYLVKEKDRNIQNPRARISIKPWISLDGKETVLLPNRTVYGEDLEGFRESVEKWLLSVQKISKGAYKNIEGLHYDGVRRVCTLKWLVPEVLLDNIVEGKWKIEGGGVRVNGNINLSDEDVQWESFSDILKDLKWESINGSLNLSDLPFKNLEGCPPYVKDFEFTNNRLLTLEGGPSHVKTFYIPRSRNLRDLRGSPRIVDYYNCNGSSIDSLEGAPKKVKEFKCESCRNLQDLQGAPQRVKKFYCSYSGLESLKGSPQEVKEFYCEHNRLDTLEGGPKEVQIMNLVGCGLKSLEGAPSKLETVWLKDNRLRSLKGLPLSLKEVRISNSSEGNNWIDDLEGFPQKIGELYLGRNVTPFTDEELRKVSDIRQIIRS